MKKIYSEKTVESFIQKCRYQEILKSLPVRKYVIQYEQGEYLTDPSHTELLFRIIAEGTIDIYFIRDDGTRYALSNGGAGYMIGDSDFFETGNKGIIAEASEDVTCIAFSIKENRDALLNHISFLRLIAESLSKKMAAITELDALPASLEERVTTYMKFKCKNGTLKGIERAAFRMRCSSRQLQRIMNRLEADGTVIKIGRGCYQLNI